MIYRTALSSFILAATLSIVSGETLEFSDLTARQKSQFHDMHMSYYYIGEIDWSLRRCAYEIPAQIERASEISEAGGNSGLSVTSPTIYCSARYFPTTDKTQCESSMENIAIASQINRAFGESRFVAEILKKCSEATTSAFHQGRTASERKEGLQAPLSDQPRWVEITRPMISCESDLGTPASVLKQRMFQAIVAWRSGMSPPPGCSVMKPGLKLLDFNDQTEAEKRELLRLGVPNCKKGCVPFSSPVYAPPWQLFGPYAKHSSPPPGW